MNFLKPTLDLSAIAAPTNTDVDTAIKTSEPESQYGWVILSTTAPDVVENPLYARFMWARVVSGELNGEFYYYNGMAWEQIVTDDGARLLPGTIPLDRLLAPAASGGYVLTVNSGSDGIQAVAAASIFGAGSIGISKLAGGVDSSKVYFLLSNNGVREWQEATNDWLLSRITEIPLSKLNKPTEQRLLGLVGSDLSWGTPSQVIADGTIPLAKVQKDETKKGYYFGYNPTTGAAEARPIGAGEGGGIVVPSGLLAVPINPASAIFTHGIGVIPDHVAVYLECYTATDGYNVGERLPIDCVRSSAATDEDDLYCVLTSILTVEVFAFNSEVGYYPAKAGGTVAFDRTMWRVRIIAFRGTSTGTVFATDAEVAAGVEAAKAISPANVKSIASGVKASAVVTISVGVSGVTAAALDNGYNVASVSVVSNKLRVTFTNALAAATYGVLAFCGADGVLVSNTPSTVQNRTTTYFDLAAVGNGGSFVGQTLSLIVI